MVDQSEQSQLSREPLKREGRGSNGRHKLKSTTSGAKDSPPQSDASSSKNSLAKPEPASLPTEHKKKSDEIVEIEINDSANTISFKRERVFGTTNFNSIRSLSKQVTGFVPTVAGKPDSQTLKWALTTLHEIAPKDELERLLAVQMIGVHSLAVECLRRASLEGQTTVAMDANVHRVTRLLRTFTMQMEALNRHRGKVGQQMVVGNVNVNEGGQAIVGPVSQGAGGKASTEDDADKVK